MQPTATQSGHNDCSICLEQLERRGGLPIINPGCGHSVHLACQRTHLLTHPNATCSLCRGPLNMMMVAPTPRFLPIPSAPPEPMLHTVTRPERADAIVPVTTTAIQIPQVSLRLDGKALEGSKKSFMASLNVADSAFSETRNPLDIVAVVDISGSMSGRNIEHVKETLKHVVAVGFKRARAISNADFSSGPHRLRPTGYRSL